MKTILLSILLLTISTASFCTLDTIKRSGYTFVPSPLTITLGDSVYFKLSTFHRVIEVSQATWNANDTTPLPGFQPTVGGGIVLPAQLTVGTHYYVCGEHVASEGMKGIIIVQYPEGIEENSLNSNISIFPNPSNGKFQLEINNPQFVKNYFLEIYNSQGKNVYSTSNIKLVTLNRHPELVEGSKGHTSNEFDISELPKGIYFIRLYDGTLIFEKKIIIQ